jgi:hypothetical protein
MAPVRPVAPVKPCGPNTLPAFIVVELESVIISEPPPLTFKP